MLDYLECALDDAPERGWIGYRKDNLVKLYPDFMKCQ